MLKKPPVIVIRGNDICYIGIVRSCFKSNIPCVAVHFTWPNAPRWYSDESCYKPDIINIDNPFTNTGKAVKQLQDALKEQYNKWKQKLILIVSSDTNYMFILDNYSKFSKYIILMGSHDFETPRNDIVHKGLCAEMLSHSVPEVVPLTNRCKSIEDIESIINQIDYPVVYKPAVKDYGQTFYSKHDGNKAIECNDPSDLKIKLVNEIKDGFDLVVQEKVEFDSVYDEIPFYLYANKRSEITMASNGIKEIIEPFPFGTAISLRFSWHPELVDLAQKIVTALRYRGVLMIEFVKDNKDGRWKVIELNPRHWLFNGFYQRVGFDFTKSLYEDYYSDKVKTQMLLPSAALLEKNYAHIDILSIANYFSRSSKDGYSLNEFIEQVSNIGGSISTVYMDPLDAKPGRELLIDIASKFNWNSDDLVNQMNQIVCDV